MISPFLLFFCTHLYASHISGGGFTYKYLGQETIGGVVHNKYQIILTIYEDCLNGQPSAIAADDPASFAVYDSSGNLIVYDSTIHFDTSYNLPIKFSDSCTVACLLNKTFTTVFSLPLSTKGYIVDYQRCCRAASIFNINDPGNSGITMFCKIPPSGIVNSNNSAVFTTTLPNLLMVNQAFSYDNSATDADGDSLSYELCPAYKGGSNVDIKPPIPYPPPFDTLVYKANYSSQFPLGNTSAFLIDAHTGLLTGTPDEMGRYIIAISCHEWRSGVMINTIYREFILIVTTDCATIHSQTKIPDDSLYMPTAFTPNDDGNNDKFKPVSLGNITFKSFKVFDRKGVQVFSGKSLSDGWDGTFNSTKQDIGTYYWEFLYEDTKGKQMKKGEVTLIR